MSKATLNERPPADLSKLDRRNYSAMMWKAAYRQARSMIRDGSRHGYRARYVWALDHMRRPFGARGWPVCQQAARVAFDLRAVSKAATGTPAELARQGMLTRAVRVEPAPRGGWSWAWTFDELGSPNTARSLRRHRAKRLREARAVAREMARDRLAMQAEERFAITPAGIAALRAAEAARATI